MADTAIYARVSSGRQEKEDTVQSQLEELRSRALEDRYQAFEEFIDENYSRDTLARPALDRLREVPVNGSRRLWTGSSEIPRTKENSPTIDTKAWNPLIGCQKAPIVRTIRRVVG